MKKSPYVILGVDPTATADEIKKAYRALAMKHHPDKGGDGVIFKELAEANAILSDDEKRARFDAGESFESICGVQVDLEMKAIGAVVSVFVEIVKKRNIEYTDIVKEIKSVFTNAEKSFLDQKVQAEAAIKKFQKIMDRMKRKDEGAENIFVRSSISQIEMLKMQIERVDQELKVAVRALEVVEAYQYNMEDLPQLDNDLLRSGTFTINGFRF